MVQYEHKHSYKVRANVRARVSRPLPGNLRALSENMGDTGDTQNTTWRYFRTRCEKNACSLAGLSTKSGTYSTRHSDDDKPEASATRSDTTELGRHLLDRQLRDVSTHD